MTDGDTTDPRRRIVEVEERIDRIGKRLTAGYGSDSDREGWLLWLRQLEAQREALRARLGDDEPDTDRPGDSPRT
jgi:hypothetical protein